MLRRAAKSTLFPYTTLFRSGQESAIGGVGAATRAVAQRPLVVLAQQVCGVGAVAGGHALGDEQGRARDRRRSEEHTSELQSQSNLVCRLLLEKKKQQKKTNH